MDAVVENDLSENTIISLIGDHGWTLGENQVSVFEKRLQEWYMNLFIIMNFSKCKVLESSNYSKCNK